MNVPAASDVVVYALAFVGAWTVGTYLGEAIQLKRMMAVPDDVRRLT